LSQNQRVAIIGMGPMGRRHLQALSLVEDTELVAVADTSLQALAADGLQSVLSYTDAHTMLADVQPEIVIVATNGPSHHELVLSAIAAGARGILCEKPIACSAAEAEEMVLAGREHQCALAVNYCRRHVPAYRWLRERLKSGEWGQLRSMRGSWPGIGLGCTATHMTDLWRFLSGEEMDTVFGWIDPVRGPNPRGADFCDPGGMIVATCASGTRYVHEQTEDGAGPGMFVIDTTGMEVRVDERAGSVSVLARDWSVKPGPGRSAKYDVVRPPADAPLAVDIVRFSAETLRELVAGRTLTCDAEDGLRSLEVIVAAHLSHDRGHAPVTLPLSDFGSKAKWLPIT
jgi:predicted dehydrogenase